MAASFSFSSFNASRLALIRACSTFNSISLFECAALACAASAFALAMATAIDIFELDDVPEERELTDLLSPFSLFLLLAADIMTVRF